MAPAPKGCSLKIRHTALRSPRLLQQASGHTPCLAIFEAAAQGRNDHEQALLKPSQAVGVLVIHQQRGQVG